MIMRTQGLLIKAALCSLVAIVSVSYAYEDTPEEPLGSGGSRICNDPGEHTQSWEIAPPFALASGGGEVEIRFSARADLDATNEWIDVTINGIPFDESLGGPSSGRLFGVPGMAFDLEV